ncbi:MAG TPA: YHS domain-containing (seleno)protein [Polyangiales bacterium]|nr:YHS domain-containing (seleno)protein [Polyangiales bacterium]
MFRWMQSVAFGLLLSLALAPAAHTQGKPNKINSNDSAYAIGGYDPVAYFEEGKPVRGKPELGSDYRGARWLFSSEARLKKFAKNPAAWVPQYDGYCAYGVSRGYLVNIDPAAFTVRDGKLYLNYSLDIRKQWLADVQARIVKADELFPSLSH